MDMKGECKKYGEIINWLVYMLGEDIRIFVEYKDKESAIKAYGNLHGRFYD